MFEHDESQVAIAIHMAEESGDTSVIVTIPQLLTALAEVMLVAKKIAIKSKKCVDPAEIEQLRSEADRRTAGSPTPCCNSQWSKKKLSG